MKIQFKLGYYGYIVDRENIPVLMDIFTRATSCDGSFIQCGVEEVPDIERNKMKEELKKELGDEAQKYSNYWLQERDESEKLRKELKELKEGVK